MLWLSVLPGGGKDDRVLDHFYAALPSEHPGQVEYLDIESALRAPGRTAGRASSVTGRLRQLDGWHLCQDGAAAVANAALEHIGLDPPGWSSGAWRGDERYQPASEGCPS